MCEWCNRRNQLKVACVCKRVRYCDLPAASWRRAAALQQLGWVEPFVETKTLWHPVAP